MNNKNKILLTSVGLAMLSGIAATSSTFAWFTTTRTASISYTSATVTSTQSSLTVKFAGSPNSVTADTLVPTNALAITGGNEITDISSDGLNFYKPVWSSNNAIASEINEELTAEGNWIEFTIEIAKTSTNDLEVYLGAGTKITPKTALDAEDLKAVDAARLAVVDAADAVMFYYAPSDSAHTYITTAAAGTDAYGIDGFDQVTTSLDVYSAFTTEPNQTLADATGSKIATLTGAAGASVEVTFRAWLEGEDADAVNAAIGGVFDIALDIYGLEA